MSERLAKWETQMSKVFLATENPSFSRTPGGAYGWGDRRQPQKPLVRASGEAVSSWVRWSCSNFDVRSLYDCGPIIFTSNFSF